MPANQPPNIDGLDRAFDDASTEERVYGRLVQSRTPKSVSEFVDEVGCSKDTAKKYLDWFTELGIARRDEGRPTRYERNEDYFEWRYVNELVDSHSIDELRETVAELRERLETLRAEYDADAPESVDLRRAAQVRDAPIETVWDDLSMWAGLEDELRLHDRARQRLTERGAASGLNAD